VQVIVMPITDRTAEYAAQVTKRLEEAGFRVENDTRNEKIGFKIREAQVRKIPYMLVLGDKEAEQGIVTVRKRSVGDLGATDLQSFIAQITQERDTKAYK